MSVAAAARAGVPPGGETPGAPAQARTFHALDALRGLAAAVIVLFHAGFLYGDVAVPDGFLAVDLFFCMSGFIIAHRYDGDLARGLGVGGFAALRLARLYPLFLLGAALGLVPTLASLAAGDRGAYHLGMLAAVPGMLLMLPSHALMPALKVLYPLNFVSWSLALEIAVNLAYAAAFRVLTARVLGVVAAAGLAGLCACALGWGTLQVGFEWPHAAGGAARVGYGFAVGALIRRAHAHAMLPRVPWFVPLAAALALFRLTPLAGGVAADLVGCALVVPLIVAAAASCEPPRALHRACAAAGTLSYAMYSLHVPLIGLFLRLEGRVQGSVARQTLADALAFTALLAALCFLADRLYDRPLRRALMRRLARRPVVAAHLNFPRREAA